MAMNAAGRWGSRQWVRLTKEATRGEFDTGASAGNIAWMRLDSDNAFDMDMAPQQYMIRSADALNMPVQSDFQHYKTTGSLNTLMYPSQANFLLDWAITLASAGTPATYTPKTVTAHWFDGVRVREFLGVHVMTFGLTSTAGQPVRLALGLEAWKESLSHSVALAEPASTVFPTDLPFNHGATSGGLKIGSNTARTQYESFGLNIANLNAVSFNEATYPDIDFGGRDATFTAGLRFASGEIDRAAFQTHATLTQADITFARTGAHTVKLDLRTRGKLTAVTHARPMAGQIMANFTGTALWTAATTGGGAIPAGNIHYTVTDPA